MADEDIDLSLEDIPDYPFEGYDDDFDHELEGDEDRHEPPPNITNPHPPAHRNECLVCTEERNDLATLLPCGHQVCTDCQRAAFRLAISSQERYTPRCCSTELPLRLAAQVLDNDEFRAYRTRLEELGTSQPLYCAVPNCSTFIPREAVDNEHGTCPQCGQRTHTVCKELEHPGRSCPEDVDLASVYQLANAEGWRRCDGCGSIIERTAGCNQLRCRCGYQFCWRCGRPTGACICMAGQQHGPGLIQQGLERLAAATPGPREDYNDFLQFDRIFENAGVGDNLVGILGRFGIGAALEGPRRCPDGQHTEWHTRRDGHLVCEVCQEVMPHFIMECEACGLRVCFGCRGSL